MEGLFVFNDLFFYTASVIAAIVLFLTQTINKIFTISKSWVKQLISWVLAVGVTLLFYFTHLLYWSTVEGESSIWMLIVCGIITGLVANGIYDIPAIKAFLDKIFNMPKFDKDGNKIES